MNILCIGDVIGAIGCDFLQKNLPAVKKSQGIDLVICNGENSANGNGISPTSMQQLFNSGVDVITTGNHAFKRKEIYTFFENQPCLIRPGNLPRTTPGKGICVLNKGCIQVAILNLMGTVYMESLESPFDVADRFLTETSGVRIKIIDFHAEATSEKKALGWYLDGKVSALFGTHTHVQTADETILPGGTGYITDVGMTGPINSVLGVKSELAVKKFRTKMPVAFETADGECSMQTVLFSIDNRTGKTVITERLEIR